MEEVKKEEVVIKVFDQHFTYLITYTGGKSTEETVIDCDTVDKFKMRKFGSVNPDEYGVKVELIAIDGQKPPSADVVQKPVVPVAQPTQTNSATDAPASPAPAAAAPVTAPAAAVAPAPVKEAPHVGKSVLKAKK